MANKENIATLVHKHLPWKYRLYGRLFVRTFVLLYSLVFAGIASFVFTKFGWAGSALPVILVIAILTVVFVEVWFLKHHEAYAFFALSVWVLAIATPFLINVWLITFWIPGQTKRIMAVLSKLGGTVGDASQFCMQH